MNVCKGEMFPICILISLLSSYPFLASTKVCVCLAPQSLLPALAHEWQRGRDITA